MGETTSSRNLHFLHYEPLQPPQEPVGLDSNALVDPQNEQRFLRALGGLGMYACVDYSEFMTELDAATFLFHYSRFDRRW